MSVPERPRVGTKAWFGPKQVSGWGWSPVSWEGWLVVGGLVLALLVPVSFLRNTFGTVAYLAWVLIVTIGFAVCCVLKAIGPGGPTDSDRYA